MVVIANWPQPREAHWLALLQARAIENQAYVVGVNRCGQRSARPLRGPQPDPRPARRDPGRGRRAGAVAPAEIELAPLLEYRQQFPALADMRAEFFGRVARAWPVPDRRRPPANRFFAAALPLPGGPCFN